MAKGFFVFFLLAMTFYVPVHAQNDIVSKITAIKHDYKHSRISLITCTEGNESWESFGHSTVRVIDSSRNDLFRDMIYNYGTFDVFDGGISYKFLRGKMHAYLEPAPYTMFIKNYIDEGRGVTEQVFLLNED